MPLWDWYEIPRLKASPDPPEKVRYYLKMVTAFRGLTVVAGLSPGQRIYDRGADADWTFSGDDVAGHGKSAAADGGSCNVGLRVSVLLPKGFALAEEKVVTTLIEVKSPS